MEVGCAYLITHNGFMKNIHCFICNKDITKGIKVASFHNYPDGFWDEKIKNWNKRLPKILNGVMCQECSNKDLELAHARATGKEKEFIELKETYERAISQRWFKLGKLLKLL